VCVYVSRLNVTHQVHGSKSFNIALTEILIPGFHSMDIYIIIYIYIYLIFSRPGHVPLVLILTLSFDYSSIIAT